MKTKLVAITILTFTSIFSTYSQEVEIKKDKVLLDGKEILRYEKENIFNQSFYSLTDDEEILHFRFSNNETQQYLEDDYFILDFLKEKIKVESSEVYRATVIMSSRKSSEKLIKWLLKDKVLNTDGTINSEKLDNFHQKYNEDITNRTMDVKIRY
jgi:AAA+ superfamily predicted ATPase